ncbi:MAG: aminodeoxychorismate/anthranilate synthase component II [Syntrophales bacterium]|jgi:anthranilate synthase/aminodeoxychorismate synthase-like glutamine amidotransferase|nr:aminodeoxychorismate/anthranilate synthase component II [Syntrophales bacterium]
MVLLIDNYDSFSYNIVQYLGQLGREVAVFRNDCITIEQIKTLKPECIFISPGPRSPGEAGATVSIISNFFQEVPIMGICLGHQAIGYAFGASVIRAERIMHGKASLILNDGKTIYSGLPSPFAAGRYHSLILDRKTIPRCLEISARTEEGEVMGIRHRAYPTEGVQFHPESILTPQGKKIIKNFLHYSEGDSK